MSNLTISNELLMVGAKSKLAPTIKKWVEDYRKMSVDSDNYSTNEFKKLNTEFIKEIKKVFGVTLGLEVYDIPGIVLGVRSNIIFYGYQGSRWYRDDKLRLLPNDDKELKEFLQIDLKNVKVSGSLTDMAGFNLIVSHQLLNGYAGYTVDELVAAILHEFGHMLNSFMYLGDYVWLNYYLTDGIEVMLGNKKATIDIELYNDTWLKNNVPEKELVDFEQNKSEETAKRVVFSVVPKLQRHHLTNNDITAKRREEQTADMFVTRLGYGRDLAKALHRLHRHDEEPTLSQSYWFGECAKLFVTVLALPLAIIGLMVYDPAGGDAYTMDGRYDDPMDRIVKVRRDLIAQLKNPGPLNKQTLVDDIDAIDAIIKEYTKHPSVFDGIINFFRPSVRKMRQNTKVEDDLESLLNNNLFVQAHKLAKL